MTARPSVVASVLAVGVAAGTLTLLYDGVHLSWLVVELGALVVVAAGLALRRRGSSDAGLAVALVGGVGFAGAVGLAASSATGTSELLRVVPGALGVGALALAVMPLREHGTRWLVKAGAGGVYLSVLFTGLFRPASFDVLLLAMAGAVVAWDAGEHAIDVGRQLGRTATTWRLDLSHVAATAAVGILGVILGHVVAGVNAGSLSLGSYALLFLALVILTGVLHR